MTLLQIVACFGTIVHAPCQTTGMPICKTMAAAAESASIADRKDVETERLSECAALLYCADVLLRRQPVASLEIVRAEMRRKSRADLQSEIHRLAKAASGRFTFASKDREKEGVAFGHVKNAYLRLLFDRAEPQRGHEIWSGQVKVAAFKREVQKYLDALVQATRPGPARPVPEKRSADSNF